MHRTWKYSVKSLLREKVNELRVYFYSPTKYIASAFEKSKTSGTEDAMNGFVHIRKAHCMFGWDWGAHLPDAGIWRAVQLLGVDTAYLESVEVLQYHEKDKVTLDIRPEIIVVSEKMFQKICIIKLRPKIHVGMCLSARKAVIRKS